MAKKKKAPPSKRSDARGYATTSTSASSAVGSSLPIKQQATTSTLPKLSSAAATGSSAFVVSPSIYETLQELLALLPPSPQSLPPIPLLSPTVLLKRVGTLYDGLTLHGFSHAHIRAAATAGALTTNDALDWLCANLSVEELPLAFVEPWVRDAVAHHERPTTLTVVRQRPRATDSIAPKLSAVTSTHVAMAVPMREHRVAPSNETTDDAHSDLAARRAWLLERYQYEDEEDCDENEDKEHSPAVLVTTVPDDDELDEFLQSTSETIPSRDELDEFLQSETVDDATRRNDVPSEPTETLEVVPTIVAATEPSPHDLRLTQLRLELLDLEADANNDANNYMRSKPEIKALQQQVKSMRQQVQGLERKVKRETSRPTPVATMEPATADQDRGLEDDDGALFSMFTAINDKSAKPSIVEPESEPSPSSGIVIPTDAIPPKWTGQTPRVYLEEWCRKEKAPKPNFQKLPRHGCRLRVVTKSGDTAGTTVSITVEEAGPHESYSNVQHYVATKVLYQINPTLPLYRLFPPFYRDVWLQWLNEKQTEKATEQAVVAESRRILLDDILQCLPKPSSVATKDANSRVDEDVVDDSIEHHSNSLVWGETTVESSMSKHPKEPTDLGVRLQNDFVRRTNSPKYKKMLVDRMHLPIYSHRQHILDTVRQHPVTILCAETGSGKTTQCSSYILEEAMEQTFGDATSILCTQPRRVAAISVAERVADELGDVAIGKGLVGYQIRMETRRGPETRLLFCTTGVILRRLIEDPTLNGISHVVVDEVHERQWQIDVLLVALRSLLNGSRPDLKVILMSATLDEKLFGTFFAGAPVVKVPGRTYPVATYYLEDLLEHSSHVIENGSRYAHRDYSNRKTVSMYVTSRGGEKRRETADYQMHEDVSDDYPGYGIATRKSMDRVDETVLNYDLIEDVLSLLLLEASCAFKLPSNDSQSDRDNGKDLSSGAVLVFMPGLGEIRTLVDRLAGSKAFGDRRRFDVIPLHSTLTSVEQKRAFVASPNGCRKIIISTNVAETSVTIPDVVFVIDSGRVRELQRDKRTGTRKLVATWCSRASAKQRSGRAGRVQAGICLKLYSSGTESHVMKSSSEPELRRIPLEEVCLTILAGGFAKSCTQFLAQTPQPPDDNAVVAAIKVLEGVGALVSDQVTNSGESLTALGRHLAKLPVDARVGKMLIFGSVFKCIDSILTIASCLSASKSPFASSFDDNQQMKATHAQFSHQFSDFLTLVKVWEEFRHADQAGSARKFCREKFLNHAALREIQDARYHYLDLLCGLGFIDRAKLTDGSRKGSFDETRLVASEYCRNSRFEQVVHSVVCAGLNPNVAHLAWANANGELSVTHKTEKLAIQSSVNSKLPRQVPSSWLTFFEKFATERKVSISKTAFVSPICLMLFGSSFQVLHTEKKVLVDDWILIPTAAKTGVMFRVIRDGLDDIVTSLIEDSGLSDHKPLSRQNVESVINVIVTLITKG